jgi:FtsP/CotA-like multicopper oxidase with cupredoxin domain
VPPRPDRDRGSGRWRLAAALVVTLLVLVPLGWYWQASRLPSTYSVADMGYLDFGGAGSRQAGAAHQHDGRVPPSASQHQRAAAEGRTVSVAALRPAADRAADVKVDLVAHQGPLTLADGHRLTGFTLNGTSPGPTIEATEGQLVQVTVRNDNVAEGMTLHWHGLDVPNGEDGVAGVTQDAVSPGHTFTYRFVADVAGTYWYHSHQVSHEQVVGGLFGALVVHPAAQEGGVLDALAVSHVYDGRGTINGREGDVAQVAQPGQRVRVRVVNTDNGPSEVWSSAPYRLVAVDARDLHEPGQVSGQSVTVTAGGRADLEVVVPADGTGVRIIVGGGSSLVVGPAGAAAPRPAQPQHQLDLLAYGAPAPVGFDTTHSDRSFEYSIGRRPGFVNGKPGLWWSVNGHLLPNLPMFVVSEGDVVKVTITNHSGDVHPMHLHGHHAVVLSRDGKPATGSPWWVDSLNVRDGETYVVEFLADNPGIWMDHCHNLKHAAQGLVTHLMYEGVSEPFRVGGTAGNEPE